jgi:exonuclease SbcC
LITSINIKNFQSHRDTTLELASGVNVIAGSTDAGKSAIIRAMRWVFENRPLGSAYMSTFAGKGEQTEVTINLAGGGFVTRRKGNGFNGYVVGEYGKWEKEFDAVKTDVPQTVKDLFPLADYNVRSQHDGPYLIADSPPKVSKELSDLVGIGIIDKAVGVANTTSKRIGGEVKGLEAELTKLSIWIAELEGVDILDSGITSAVADLDGLDKLANQHEELALLILRAKELEGQLVDDFEMVESAGKLLGMAEDQYTYVKGVEAERRDLRKLVVRAMQLKNELETASDLEEVNVAFDRIVKDTHDCPICGNALRPKHKETLRKWVFGRVEDEVRRVSRLAYT